ncbi:MAG: lytic murein transglycosylase, partial [Rhodospirillales bacterium]|nr:lytic murein transglycosylase [Rhodospirillales bacterium]
LTPLWGVLLFCLISTGALAQKIVPEAPPFDAWLAELKQDARTRGISADVVARTLDGVQPIPRVLELDRQQPEFTLTFWSYMEKAVNAQRIAKGRELLVTHKKLLDDIHSKYGVPPRYLVAFWGLESNFGQYTGVFPVVAALVTLAHDRRRSGFFREQLLAVLGLIDTGDIAPDTKASWAGAMGNHQFIPTTYRDFAVDGNGDGKRDLWHTLPDIFGSAANYLKGAGWEKQWSWGREARLPKGFAYELTGLNVRKPLSEWQKLGVRRANGKNLPVADIEASVVLPAGYQGPAFLVYKNYRTIMVWNRSILYALAVGHLADRFAGGSALVAKKPANDRPLSSHDVSAIQRKLSGLGFDAGDADGIVGSQTRKAIKGFQQQAGLPADGYPSAGLLERLNGASK